MNKPDKKSMEEEKIEVSVAEKVALLLKHDSQCSVTQTGVCNCWFYDVANQLVKLFTESLKGQRQELIEDIEERLTKQFMNMEYDGGVDKGENEHWHYFFEDTVWKNFEKVFKKLQAIKEK